MWHRCFYLGGMLTENFNRPSCREVKFEELYIKKYQYSQYEINIIRCIMRCIFILYSFSNVDVHIFWNKFGQTLCSLTLFKFYTRSKKKRWCWSMSNDAPSWISYVCTCESTTGPTNSMQPLVLVHVDVRTTASSIQQQAYANFATVTTYENEPVDSPPLGLPLRRPVVAGRRTLVSRLPLVDS